MNRFVVLMAVALLSVLGCGGDESGGGTTPGGNNTAQKCSASNCAGCCFNNVCQAGTALSACGKSGATCQTCGSAQVCKMDQTCGVDPAGVWRVQPVSAQIAANNNGSSWDADGSAPDVFIAMQCPGGSPATSTPEVQGYTPSWTSGGCTATASQLLADKVLFQVWDSDVSSNDTITDVLAAKITEANLIAGKVTYVPSGGMKSLTVQFQKQP